MNTRRGNAPPVKSILDAQSPKRKNASGFVACLFDWNFALVPVQGCKMLYSKYAKEDFSKQSFILLFVLLYKFIYGTARIKLNENSGDLLRRNLMVSASRKGDAAAIRYGDSSDCLDSGRISGDARTQSGRRVSTSLQRKIARFPRVPSNRRVAPVRIDDRRFKITIQVWVVISMVAVRDMLEYAKIHLPILLGTHTSVRRKQPPREVHRIH